VLYAFRTRLLECHGAKNVHVVGRSKGVKLLLDLDYVIETQEIDGRTYSQKQPEGTFSQPNGYMCAKMVSWAVEQTKDSPGDCLELYCGNGNFTIPMSKHFRRVVATEVRFVDLSLCDQLDGKEVLFCA
jgi:tRNA (uracil-5-)-methyltransferase